MATFSPKFEGFFPYIQTGTETSAALMNSLYSGAEELINTVTNGKSPFFLNTINYREIDKYGSPGNELLNCYNLYEGAINLCGAEDPCYYNCNQLAAYYGFLPMTFDEVEFSTTYDSNAEVVTHNKKGAGLGVRQFYFLSGVKTGDCDPADPEGDGNCVGSNANIPYGEVGWWWKLWGFWYQRGALKRSLTRDATPPIYKHDHYEDIASSATITDYNVERGIAQVVENGYYTSDYGRQAATFSNPITNQTEPLPCPYAIGGAAAYYCTNLDHSLGVHTVSNSNPSIIPNWTNTAADLTMVSSSGSVLGNVIIDAGTGVTGTYPSGISSSMRVGGQTNIGPTVDEINLSEKLRHHNLAKSSQKPKKYKFDDYSSVKYADREDLKEIAETYNVHVCPHTHAGEVQNIKDGLSSAMSTGRSIVSGQDCTNPYLCWLYQDKTNFWEDIVTGVNALSAGDQEITITYSFARTGTPISPQPSEQSLYGISGTAESDTWANTNGANGINPSGHTINHTDFETEIAGAFSYWKDLIEKTYSGCNTACGSDGPTNLTVNFVNLGTEYSNAEGSAGAHAWRGAEDFPINSEIPVSMGIDIGTGYGPLNIGRIRIAVTRTGDWSSNATAAFAYLPDGTTTSSRQGDIVINPNLCWKKDDEVNEEKFGGGMSINLDKSVSLRYILAHEIGHSLGFGHSNSAKCDTPMTPVYFWNESLASGFSGGFSEYTDGKCVKELYGDCQAGDVCLSGMNIVSVFQTPVTQTGFNTAYDDSLYWPWYWPYIQTNPNVFPGISLSDCFDLPQQCQSYPAWIDTNVPMLENRFEQAELIFDGYETCDDCGLDHDGESQFNGYGDYTFSNKFNKYKFFRIHNLNNYDMTFTFAPDEGLNEASKVNVGLYQKSDESIVAVKECGAGTGTTFTIPKHESICVRRDFGEYTLGSKHFQKFLPGDQRVNQKLAEKDLLGHDAYPDYYHNFPARDHYLFEKASHNIVNPFVINDWLNMLEDRLLIDETPPRVWNANSLYLDPIDYETTDGVTQRKLRYRGDNKSYHYDEWLQPTWYNSYQNLNGYSVSPLNENTVLADFIYHTGWAVQTYALQSGEMKQNARWDNALIGTPDKSAAYFKRLVPYSGARYVYKFLQDLNVNVMGIGRAKHGLAVDIGLPLPDGVMDEAVAYDDGRSGLYAGPTGWAFAVSSEVGSRPTDGQCDPAVPECGDTNQHHSGSASDLLKKYFDYDDPKALGIIPKGGHQWVIGNPYDLTHRGPVPLNDPTDGRAANHAIGFPRTGDHANEIANLQCDMLKQWDNDLTNDDSSIDPFALSIHQWNLNTNILGAKGAYNYAKGQIYPLSSGPNKECGFVAGAGKILPSFIDFVAFQKIHYGDYYYISKINTGVMITGADYYPVAYAEYPKYLNHYREKDRGTDEYNAFDCYPHQYGNSQSDRSVAYGNYGWQETRTDGGAQDNPPCARIWHPLTGGYSGFDPANRDAPTGVITVGTTTDGPCSSVGGADCFAAKTNWNATGASGWSEDFVVDWPHVPTGSFEWFYYIPKPHLFLKEDANGIPTSQRLGLRFDLLDDYDLAYLNVGWLDVNESGPTLQCNNYEQNSSLYIPINTSHIMKVIRGGIVTDDSMPHIVRTGGLTFPLHYYHPHSTHITQAGAGTTAGVRGQNQDIPADFVGPSQTVNWYPYGQNVPNHSSGTRNLFGMTVGDFADALYEFNRIDGLWTGYNSGERFLPHSGLDVDDTVKITKDFESITRITPPGPTISGFITVDGAEQVDNNGGIDTSQADYNSGDLFSTKLKDAFNINPVGTSSVSVSQRSEDPIVMPMMMYQAENNSLHYAYQKNVNPIFRMPQGAQNLFDRRMIKAGNVVVKQKERLLLGNLTGRYENSPVLFTRKRGKMPTNTPQVYNDYNVVDYDRRLQCNSYYSATTCCEFPNFYPCNTQGGGWAGGANTAAPHKGQDFADSIQGISASRPASFFWNTTRQPWKSSRLHGAQGAYSPYFTGNHPLGGLFLFHWSGIFNLHPEIRMLNYMDVEVMGAHTGVYGIGEFTNDGRENKLLGYSAEYWPLDSTWRMGSSVNPYQSTWSDQTKGNTTTTTAMDLHFSNYGPPAKLNHVTGALVGSGGSGYWPACNFIREDLLGSASREATHGQYCPSIIFRTVNDTGITQQTAIDEMHPGEILASGVPIIGCTWAEKPEGSCLAPDGTDVWTAMLAGRDYEVVGVVLKGGISKNGTAIPADTIYYFDHEKNTKSATSYGRYLFQNSNPIVVGAENWPSSYPTITKTSCDPVNDEVFSGPFFENGVQDLAFADFPSGASASIGVYTYQSYTGQVSANTVAKGSQIKDEGLAHFSLNNMDQGWNWTNSILGNGVDLDFSYEPCLYDYTWNRETLPGAHSNIYTDFSGYSR